MTGILLLKLGRLSLFADRMELKVGASTGGVKTLAYGQVARTELDEGWFSSTLKVESKEGDSISIDGVSNNAKRARDLIEHFKDKAAGLIKSDLPLLAVAGKHESFRMSLTIYEDRLVWSSGATASRTVRFEHVVSVHRDRFGLLMSHIEIETVGGGGFGVPNLLPGEASKAQELIEHQISGLHRKDLDQKPQPEACLTDVPNQIRKLAELREAGILSAEEFETKKTDLLGRM